MMDSVGLKPAQGHKARGPAPVMAVGQNFCVDQDAWPSPRPKLAWSACGHRHIVHTHAMVTAHGPCLVAGSAMAHRRPRHDEVFITGTIDRRETHWASSRRRVSHPVFKPKRMLIVYVPRNQVYTHNVQKMDTE
jgi:hypothetical protein